MSRTRILAGITVFTSGPTIQVLTDLTIAQSLILIWIFQDAKKKGRAFWPYLLITTALGSFGPLLYLILDRTSASKAS